MLITSLSTGLVQSNGATKIYNQLTATKELYEKHEQMLQQMIKTKNLPEGVKIGDIQKVEEALKKARTTKPESLSSEDIRTTLARQGEPGFERYNQPQEVLLINPESTTIRSLMVLLA